MRMNMGKEAGTGQSALTSNGGTMAGALILANGPSQPLEAATKYYVDTAFNNLNANNVLSGTLPISSLPNLTGDVTSSQGSNVISLTDIGTIPGSYAKVVVDAKGRVTSGDNLATTDIPDFDWSKITTGKPTTLSGYGITDGLNKSGGTITGILNVVSPTSNLGAVNKQYVDSKLSGSGLSVGDIIRKPYANTPAGFLRCNGAYLDKTTYAALYAVIGDTFNVVTNAGNGRPWQLQYQINTTQDGDITGWTSSGNMPGTLAGSQVIVTKNRIYMLGGNGSGQLSSVYTAPINSDGTLGTWTTGTNLPVGLTYSQAVITKNRVYLIGGGGNGISTVYTAPINSDGTLGTWSTGNDLPLPLTAVSIVMTRNRLYILGGATGSSANIVSTTYTCPVNSDGTLGTWTTGPSLPGTVGYSTVSITKNRVYLLGGYGNGTGIYTCVINADGTLGTWSSAGTLPANMSEHCSITTKNRVYILAAGYYAGLGMYMAPINPDGTLGTWTSGTNMPVSVYAAQVAVTKDHIYLLGGVGGGNHAEVYVAPILGSVNDYSPYYDGSMDPTNMFNIPDLITKEQSNVNYYIKY